MHERDALIDSPCDIDQPASQNTISQAIDRFPSKCRKEFQLVLPTCLITLSVVAQCGRFCADLSGNKSKPLRWNLISRQPCSSRVAQQAELDREPKPIGLRAVTIDQIQIGRRQRITLTYFHRQANRIR